MRLTKFKIFISLLIIFSLVLFVKPKITAQFVSQQEDIIQLGYCPTMRTEAEKLSINRGYEVKEYGSASQVLNALNNNEIQTALIGRKAYSHEINSKTQEEILQPGFTLVSNKKGFIDYSQLSLMKIYAYSSKEEVNSILSDNQNIYFLDKQKALEKIFQGEIVLINWEDWQENFGLIVVMDGLEKVECFRGVFLYTKNQ